MIGNLELLLASGRVAERVGDGGSVFEARGLPRRTATLRRPRRPQCAGEA